ncbi:MAG: protein TolR [Proteobacteria bacterium]|nr:protein TolR [Pseudomonadota bacterium]
MAMMMNGGRTRGGRLAKGHDYRPMSEINVTPMVDVMLVLLIIFMVTAPLLTVGVPVDLPKTKAALIPGKDEPLVITIDGMGRVFLQETEIELDKLVPRLKAITANKENTRIFVRGDRSVFYGQIMEVMGTVNAAGFAKVALIVELPTELPNSKTGKKGK